MSGTGGEQTTAVAGDRTQRPLTLLGMPYPDACGKPVKNPGRLDRDTCVRDAGHKGPHRGWCHPECDTCGAETKLRGLTYSCSHPSLTSEQRARLGRAWQLRLARKALAYAMTGYPDSDRPPTTEQFMQAQQIVVNLDRMGADDSINALVLEAS